MLHPILPSRPCLLTLFTLVVSTPGWALSDDGAEMSTVQVTAPKAQGFKPVTVEAGSFRGASVMEVPSTVNVVTSEVLSLQAGSGLYDAVRNTAGVTRQQNGGDTWDQLVIRGIAVENRTNYRLNGAMPIMNFSQVPMENKARVEVLKGASALYYGFTSPAGVVNFSTKRAGPKPVNSVGLSVDDQGGALISADLARRFGNEDQFGLRLNAAGGQLGNAMDGVDKGRRSFTSAAFDWRVHRGLRIQADLEYDHRHQIEQAGVALPTAVNGVITLPRAVDASKLVGPDWAVFDAETTNSLLRADLSLSDDWALTLETGRADTQRERTLPVFRFNNAATVATGAGSIRGNHQNLVVGSDLRRAELHGTVKTGAWEHDVTFGASDTRKSQDAIYQQSYTITPQNLYTPVSTGTVTYGAMPVTPTTAALDTVDQGLYLLDRITLTPSWQIFAGLRHSAYRSEQGSTRYRASENTPMLALLHKMSPDITLYGAHAQGLEEGEAAPTGTANQGERLSPGVSQQNELGLRWLTGQGTLVSAAVFDIRRPGYFTNASNVYVSDGEQRYQGLELSTQGQLTPQLAWQTSAMWLDPRFAHIGPSYNGKLPENAARQTASAFLAYRVGALPGLTLTGGSHYTGRRPVDDLNQAWLPGVNLFGIGARYESLWGDRPMTWQINVENAANKTYWAGGGNRLASGAPRTIKASVRVDL